MNTNARALAALRIVLLGLLGGWVLFIFGVHASFTSPSYEMPSDAPASVDAATYLFFGAVAVFGSASLYAKRRAQKLVADGLPLSRPVYYHAVAALIIAIAVGAWAVLMIFFDILLTDYSNLAVRVLNTYLPIILFTALVVTLLLAGFVFSRSPAAPAQLLPQGGTTPAGVPGPPSDTRASALAYAVPLVTAAIAAVATGLVYDLTGTTLTAWLWVLVFILTAAGIIAGTYYSGRLPAPSGASGLNFAWVIAFTTVVSLVSFGYGAASVYHLHIQSAAGIDVFAGGAQTSLDVNGSELRPRSEATLTLEPEGTIVRAIAADNDGWFYEEIGFPENLPSGEHTFALRAVAGDGSDLLATLTFTVDGDEIDIEEEQSSAHDSLNKTLPVSWNWLGARVLPAFLLLVLVSIVLHSTLPLRARSALVRKNE